VLAENLHGARQYGEIVTVLRDAGRGADAERWARRGLAEDSAGYWADGLRDQLAGLLLASGLREWAAGILRDQAQVKQFYVRELIGLREPGHPADVIGPLRDLIEMGIERTSDKYRYAKAIKALRRLRDDYQRAGDEEGFTTYLDELRQRQRRKTSFIAKLDAVFAPAADLAGYVARSFRVRRGGSAFPAGQGKAAASRISHRPFPPRTASTVAVRRGH